MKRWVATLLLVLMASFLAISGQDHCHEGSQVPPPHVLCLDDCAPSVLPAALVPPAADPLPRPLYEESAVRPILTLDLEPEKAPPRA